MEKKDPQPAVTDKEILQLIKAAKNKDANAMLQLIEIFKEDIQRLAKYSPSSTEEAASKIIVEFLEFIVEDPL